MEARGRFDARHQQKNIAKCKIKLEIGKRLHTPAGGKTE